MTSYQTNLERPNQQSVDVSAPGYLQTLRVAVVHEWLVTYAGAERVLEQILTIFPQAKVFSLIDCLPQEKRGFLRGCEVKSSFVQKFPKVEKYYRQLLALFPLAVEQFDLTQFDLVISSQYCVSHGVITSPGQTHISYAHSPVRYAWDLYHHYMEESGLNARKMKGWLAKIILHYIRLWDTNAAQSVDTFISNSAFVAKRIEKYYKQSAMVIHPPVDVEGFTFCDEKENFYLTASRMVPYKRIDLIVEAFSQMPDKTLVVIGEGPDENKIKALGSKNITFLGHVSFQELKQTMQKAKAFVFAAEEDFGIVPVEAQACGTPVIAYGKGGVLETIRGLDQSKPTGVFFDRQTPASVKEAVTQFEAFANTKILPANCRENAERFSNSRFREEFSDCVLSCLVQADHKLGIKETVMVGPNL
ncbi:MAG: glycosyltransferase family 4 protein [Cyanobacteria bacterium P01_H01_bin.74]